MAQSAEELLTAIKSYARGMIKGNTVDTLGAPVDIINEAIVKPLMKLAGAEKYTSDAPVGGSKSLRKLFGQPVEDANIAETVGSMVSAAGALKAIIVPAFLTKSIKQVKKAEQALNEGTDAAQVEKYTGIFRLPDHLDDGVLRAVIDDSNTKLLTAPGGLERIGTQFPLNIGPSQFYRFAPGDILPLDKVLDHPALYNAIPELRNVQVGSAGLGVNGAFYNHANNYIGLGYTGSEKTTLEYLLHEVQHGVQSRYGMNEGANPFMFMANPDSFKAAERTLQKQGTELDKLRAKYKNDDALRPVVHGRVDANSAKQKTLQDVKAAATHKYTLSAGEREASAVEAMYAARTNKSPLSYYGDDLQSLIVDPRQVGKVDQDPVVQQIIRDALASKKSNP